MLTGRKDRNIKIIAITIITIIAVIVIIIIIAIETHGGGMGTKRGGGADTKNCGWSGADTKPQRGGGETFEKNGVQTSLKACLT